MADRSPNRARLNRGRFAARHFGRYPFIHARVRWQNEPYYRQRNPLGWIHDLGAQDVFLDDFGLVLLEQIDGSWPWVREYDAAVLELHAAWSRTARRVIQKRPWWGQNFNARHRRASSGEPRSLLRLLWHFEHWADGESRGSDWIESEEINPDFSRELPAVEGQRAVDTSVVPDYSDWAADPEHWRNNFERRESTKPLPADWQHWSPPTRPTFGALLPDSMKGPVGHLPVLHPRHSTPDLPARVGVRAEDLAGYRNAIEDQGLFPTCVAHAVCAALDISMWRNPRRRDLRKMTFSRAHLHIRTGSRDTGRHLRDVGNNIQTYGLPAPKELGPYTCLTDGRLEPGDAFRERLDKKGVEITRELSPLFTKPVDVDDISTIKALLAAGWAVVVTTRITDGFVLRYTTCPAINVFGLPLKPPPTDIADEAHAWCLVGYDHVDGSDRWKYQGRFVAINSWGKNSLGSDSPYGPGTISLPFSFVASEGIEAIAIRF
jgi:hypothetical protein